MAYRRAAALATVAAAGAASAVWRRAMAGGSGGTGGGLVPGQDTPVHERDLPENVKKDFRQVRQRRRSRKAQMAAATVVGQLITDVEEGPASACS